jgi:Zn-finger nucleic acid-binding protein
VCPLCAGLWIDEDTFQRVISERAREAVVPQGGAAAAGPKPVMIADTVRYIPCPDCGKVMNRTNYSRSSGIVLDACKGHGVWCDAEELRRVIEFVQAGGLIVAHRKAAEALEMERRRLELARAMAERRPMEAAWQLPRDARASRASRGTERLGGMVIGAGLSLLFSLLRD